MDLIHLSDAIESDTCYCIFKVINVRDMDKIKAILVILIVVFFMAIMRVVFAQRKYKQVLHR